MLSQGAVAGQWVDRPCDTLQAFACKRPVIGLSPVPGRRPRVLDYVGGVSNSSAAFLDGVMYWAPGVLRTWEEANEVCKQAGGWLLEARNSDIHDLAMRLCLSVRSAIRSTVSTTGGGCWFGLFSSSGGGTEDYSWGPNGMRGKLNYPQPPWANTYPQRTNTMQCGALGMPAPAASATESAGWMNADCALRLAFLCERAVPPPPSPLTVRYRRGRVMHVHGAKLTTNSLGQQSYVQDVSSFDDADTACQRVAMRLAPAPSSDHLLDLLAAARAALSLGIPISNLSSVGAGQLPQLFWLGADNGWGSQLSDTIKWLESQDAAARADQATYSWPAQLGPTLDMWANATIPATVTRSERSCVAISSDTGKLRLLPCNTSLPYICSSALLPDLVTTRVTSTGSGSPTSMSSGTTPTTLSSSAAAAAAAAVFAPATGVQADRRATYAFFRTSLPFLDAAEACSDFGGHMVPVKSRDEDIYLSAVMARQLTAWLDVRGFWIGLRFNPFLGDGGSYDWDDPQPSPTGSPYSNFDQSKEYEPTCRSVDCCLVTRVYFDAISMAEARAAIDAAADVGNGAGDASASTGPLLTSKVDLKWASINCSLPRPFVCRRADSDGQVHNMTAYVSAHTVPLDWASADAACFTGIRAASLLPSANISFLRNRTSLALSVAYESGTFVPSLGSTSQGSGPSRPPPARSPLSRPPPRPPSPPYSQTLGASVSASTAAAWVWLGLRADRVGRWYFTNGSALAPLEVSQQIGNTLAADVLAAARWPLQNEDAKLCLAVDLNSTRAMLLPCDTDLAYLCYGGLYPASSLLTSWGQELLVIGHRLPYIAAEAACQTLGAHLASFTADAPRTTGSRMVANALGSDATFWIGLDDNSCCEDCKPDQGPIGCYRWTDGRDTSLSYHYFDPLIGLPLATPTAPTANCTAASANSLNVWTNRNCSDLLPALCMRQRRPPILYRYVDWEQLRVDSSQCGGPLEYLFLNASASRTDAESACRAHDAHLVSLHSSRDMQLLANMTIRAYTEYRRNALSLRVPAPFDTWWTGLSYAPNRFLTASTTISNASSTHVSTPWSWTDQTPYNFPAALPASVASAGSPSVLSEVPLPVVTTPRDGWCFRTASPQSLPASNGDSSVAGTVVSVDLIATQCTDTHQVLCSRPLARAPVYTAVSGALQLRFFSHIKLSRPEAAQACMQDAGALATLSSGDLQMVAQRLQKDFPSARQGVPLAWINTTAAAFAITSEVDCRALTTGGITVAVSCQTELPFICQRRLAPEASLEVSSAQSGYTAGGMLGISALRFFRAYTDAQRAASACYSMGGSLVTVRDDDETAALARLVGGTTDVIWSGMYWSAGSFYNVDGSEVTYMRWLPGEPSLVTTEQQQESASTQYCTAFVRQVGFTPEWRLRSVSCIVELPFVCREPINGPSFTTLKGTQTIAYYSNQKVSAADAASVCSANGLQLIQATSLDDVAWVRMTSSRIWKPVAELPTTLAGNAPAAVWTGLVMRAVRPAGSTSATVSLLWWPGETVPTITNASGVLQRVSAMGYGIAQGLASGTFVEQCVAIRLQGTDLFEGSPPTTTDAPASDVVWLVPCSTSLGFVCASPGSSPPAPDFSARVPAVAGSTFELYKTPLSVANAVAVCLARGGRLSSIHSLGEEVEIMDAIQRQVGDINVEPRFWIGLAQVNSSQTPRWMDGSVYEYSKIASLSPSSNTSQPLCYAVSSQGWIPRSCSMQLPFICRVPDADPHWQYARRVLRAAYYYYYFTWRPATELDADRACSAIDRYPVSFQSIVDLQELGVTMMQDVAAFDIVASNSVQPPAVAAFWSGLSLRRILIDAIANVTVLKYVWRDGTLFDMGSAIAQYLQLPPPSSASPESCVAINLATGKAFFTGCANKFFYVCKGGTFPSMYIDYDGFRLSYYPEAAAAFVAQSICMSGSSDIGSSGTIGERGTLASLRSPDEEQAVVLLTRMATNTGNATVVADFAAGFSGSQGSRNTSVWLGLQRTTLMDSFRNIDGTDVSYTNWAYGEPRGPTVNLSNNASNAAADVTDSLCVRLLVSEPKTSAWYTAPCSQQELPFICKAVSPLPEPATHWTWSGWEYSIYVPLLGNTTILDADYLRGSTYDVAQAACERVGGSLISVESTPEHEAAQIGVTSWSKDITSAVAVWVGVRAMVVYTGGDTSSATRTSGSAVLKLQYVDGSERIWDGAGPPTALLASTLTQWLGRLVANSSTPNRTIDGELSAGCVAWEVLPQSKGGPGNYTILPCDSRVPAFICKRPGSKPSLVTIINGTRYTGYTLPVKWLPADEADHACSMERQEDGLWPSNLRMKQPLSTPRLAVLTSPSVVRSLAAQLSPFVRYMNTSLFHIGLVLSKLSTGSTAAVWRDGSSYLMDWAAGIAGFSELADLLSMEQMCVAVNVTSVALVKVACGTQLPFACSGAPSPDLVYTSNRASYLVFSADLQREQARAVCKAAGAGLSVFTAALTSATTVAESQLVTKLFKQVMPARSQFWIGLRAVSTSWSWQDVPTPAAMASNQNGSSPLGSYRAWSTGEPGTGLASGLSCAAAEVVEVGIGLVLQWKPADCTRAPLPFICKVPLSVPPPQPSSVALFDYNGYEYVVASPAAAQTVSFDIASVTCTQLGGRLASLQDASLRLKLLQEALGMPAASTLAITGDMNGCSTVTGDANAYISQRIPLKQANGSSTLPLWTNIILASGRPRWADGTPFSEEQLALWDKSGQTFEPPMLNSASPPTNSSASPPPSTSFGAGSTGDQCGAIVFGRCSNGQGLIAWQSWACDSELGYVCERLPPPTIMVSRASSEYLIYNHFFTQQQARAVCTSAGASLISLQDQQEQSWILGQVSNMLIELTRASAGPGSASPPTFSFAILLGLDNGRYLDEFRWLDGSPFIYSEWAPGQPRSVSQANPRSDNASFCVSLVSITGMWQVVDCTAQSLFVCKRSRPLLSSPPNTNPSMSTPASVITLVQSPPPDSSTFVQPVSPPATDPTPPYPPKPPAMPWRQGAQPPITQSPPTQLGDPAPPPVMAPMLQHDETQPNWPRLVAKPMWPSDPTSAVPEARQRHATTPVLRLPSMATSSNITNSYMFMYGGTVSGDPQDPNGLMDDIWLLQIRPEVRWTKMRCLGSPGRRLDASLQFHAGVLILTGGVTFDVGLNAWTNVQSIYTMDLFPLELLLQAGSVATTGLPTLRWTMAEVSAGAIANSSMPCQSSSAFPPAPPLLTGASIIPLVNGDQTLQRLVYASGMGVHVRVLPQARMALPLPSNVDMFKTKLDISTPMNIYPAAGVGNSLTLQRRHMQESIDMGLSGDPDLARWLALAPRSIINCRGSGLVITSGDVHLESLAFIDCLDALHISVEPDTLVTIVDCWFENSTGSAILVTSGQVVIQRTIFHGTNGTAVLMDGANASLKLMEHSWILDNRMADRSAGLAAVNGASVNHIHACMFTRNHGQNGPAVYLGDGHGEATITNSSFLSNAAMEGAGALYVESGTILLHNTTFQGNVAGNGNGGAVLCIKCTYLGIFDSIFQQNVAQRATQSVDVKGGAVFADQTCIVHILSSVFDGNIARGCTRSLAKGGGIGVLTSCTSGRQVQHRAQVALGDVVFTNNSADLGAILLYTQELLEEPPYALIGNLQFSIGDTTSAPFIHMDGIEVKYTCYLDLSEVAATLAQLTILSPINEDLASANAIQESLVSCIHNLWTSTPANTSYYICPSWLKHPLSQFQRQAWMTTLFDNGVGLLSPKLVHLFHLDAPHLDFYSMDSSGQLVAKMETTTMDCLPGGCNITTPIGALILPPAFPAEVLPYSSYNSCYHIMVSMVSPGEGSSLDPVQVVTCATFDSSTLTMYSLAEETINDDMLTSLWASVHILWHHVQYCTYTGRASCTQICMLPSSGYTSYGTCVACWDNRMLAALVYSVTLLATLLSILIATYYLACASPNVIRSHERELLIDAEEKHVSMVQPNHARQSSSHLTDLLQDLDDDGNASYMASMQSADEQLRLSSCSSLPSWSGNTNLLQQQTKSSVLGVQGNEPDLSPGDILMTVSYDLKGSTLNSNSRSSFDYDSQDMLCTVGQYTQSTDVPHVRGMLLYLVLLGLIGKVSAAKAWIAPLRWLVQVAGLFSGVDLLGGGFISLACILDLEYMSADGFAYTHLVGWLVTGSVTAIVPVLLAVAYAILQRCRLTKQPISTGDVFWACVFCCLLVNWPFLALESISIIVPRLCLSLESISVAPQSTTYLTSAFGWTGVALTCGVFPMVCILVSHMTATGFRQHNWVHKVLHKQSTYEVLDWVSRFAFMVPIALWGSNCDSWAAFSQLAICMFGLAVSSFCGIIFRDKTAVGIQWIHGVTAAHIVGGTMLLVAQAADGAIAAGFEWAAFGFHVIVLVSTSVCCCGAALR